MEGKKLIKYSIFFLGGIFSLSFIASIYAEKIIIFLFGSQYESSGEILSILVFYIAFAWATLPFAISLQATHNEKYALWPISIMAGLNVPLNYIFFLKYGLKGIAYSSLVVFSFGALLWCLLTYFVLKKQGYLV